jgi:FkbM family methyltransferase
MKQAIKRFRDRSPLVEPACRALRATGLVPRALWQHLSFSGTVDFTVAGRRVSMRHNGAEVENSLFWAGYGEGFEGTSLLVWERLAVTSAVVFDVGANTGIYALAAHAANPRAKVHAFEPLPAIAARLSENAALNQFNTIVHTVAVSDQTGTAAIKLMQAAHEYSASFEHMPWMDEAEFVTLDVPMVRLADVISSSGDHPDLIKLDVERHEPQALRGLWPGLDNGPLPGLLVEILDVECAAAVAREIAGRGYASYAIIEGEGLRAEPLRCLPGTMNWLLLPKDGKGALAVKLAAKGAISHAELIAIRCTHATGQSDYFD